MNLNSFRIPFKIPSSGVSWANSFFQSVLENVLPPERFELQYKFSDGEAVDAIVRLDGAFGRL